ncbi:UNVERIFIED_CONTAM: Bidirectional sugar transporter SWEET2 [Sesamum calycinum]|uniref:Bidirectional sugar transporter SWEET2 n=1 Tax=Sesamum calycinum TaxID=2727403 RepID=A0AAW2Q505_9LAMI
MDVLGSLQTLATCKDAAGVAGNIFAFGLFLSPVPTFRRIIRNESTEQFSGLPYIYALLNCLVTAWYGLPMISSDNLLVTTVNSVGAVFQIVYIVMFIRYAEKAKRLRMLGLLVMVFGLFAVIAGGSLLIVDFEARHLTIGFISCASLISMSCIVHFPVCEGGFSTKARTPVRRDDSQIREDDGNYKDTVVKTVF